MEIEFNPKIQLNEVSRLEALKGLKGTSNIPSVQNLANNLKLGVITEAEYLDYFKKLETKQRVIDDRFTTK